MVSCREQPDQGTWLWLYARKFQNELPGNACATRESCSTSAIISSITKPRYVSTATLRTAGKATGGDSRPDGVAALDGRVACIVTSGCLLGYQKGAQQGFTCFF